MKVVSRPSLPEAACGSVGGGPEMVLEKRCPQGSIPYACVGGPPDDWSHYHVFLDGANVVGVIEADAVHGWLRRFQMNSKGEHVSDIFGELTLTEIVRGKVEILRVQ